MKLPNFLTFEPLIVIKRRMGIREDVYGDLTVLVDAARLTRQLPMQGLDFVQHDRWQREEPAAIADDVTRQG